MSAERDAAGLGAPPDGLGTAAIPWWRSDAAGLSLVVVAALILLALSYTTLQSSSYPTGKDVYGHLINVRLIEYRLNEGGEAYEPPLFDILFNRHVRYPPIRYVLAIAVRDRLAEKVGFYVSTVASQYPFFLLLMLSVYGLARAYAPPLYAAGVTAVVAMLPETLPELSQFTPAMPLAATTLAALFVLLRMDVFVRRRSTLAFAAICGGGAMTYYLFVIYIFPITALTFARRWRASTPGLRRNIVRNGLLAFAIGLIIGAPYYLNPDTIYPLLGEYGREASDIIDDIEFDDADDALIATRPFRAFYRYARILLERSWPFSLWPLLIVFLLARRRWRDNHFGPFVVVAASGILVLLFFYGTFEDYLAPLFPLGVVVAASAFRGMNRVLRLVLVLATVVGGGLTAYRNIEDVPKIGRGTYLRAAKIVFAGCDEERTRRVIWGNCRFTDRAYMFGRVCGFDIETLETAALDDNPRSPDEIDFIVVDGYSVFEQIVPWNRLLPDLAACRLEVRHDRVTDRMSLFFNGVNVRDRFERVPIYEAPRRFDRVQMRVYRRKGFRPFGPRAANAWGAAQPSSAPPVLSAAPESLAAPTPSPAGATAPESAKPPPGSTL